jgi:hypothetical protein
MNNKVLFAFIGVICFMGWYFKKESFQTIEETKREDSDLFYRPHVYTNQVKPALKNNDILTKSSFENMFSEFLKTINVNGPPGGANTSYEQNKYDLIFKDILVNSEKRNTERYPNPNEYSVTLNLNLNKIYKAELIEVYVPAATDNVVNIPTFANELYFTYTNGSITTTGYVIIQAGTYLNPESIATELSRQFNTVLHYAGFTLSKTVGVTVIYDRDLNRYIFQDRAFASENTLVIYPTNGYMITPDITVQNSICKYIMLNYAGPVIYPPYVSGPRQISWQPGGLYVNIASSYGEYTDSMGNVQPVPATADTQFSNCIISDVVLTHDKLYLSLGKLNGDTCNILAYETPGNVKGNVQRVFCQVPNNTVVSSAAVKTMLNQPVSYSAIQFYNPLLNQLNRLDVKWYTEEGKLVRILDHCFTLRIFYFQKRIDITDFSYQIP